MKGKKKTKKEVAVETVKRLKFGNFEVRLSRVKVEIEDVGSGLFKHVYLITSFEGGLINYLMSDYKTDESGTLIKTQAEMEESEKIIETLVYRLVYTKLLFSDIEFRNGFDKLVSEAIERQNIKESPDDANIIAEEKLIHEVKGEASK